jgi:H+/Cl- antiporter ClcA
MPPLYRKSKLIRRSRVFRGSFSLWKPRLVFWCGALAIGVISGGFAELADLAQKTFASVTTSGRWSFLLPLLITPIGFVVSAYLAAKLFPNSQGSGIPQAIAARHLHDDEDRSRLLSLRIAFGKILLTVLGLFCGASIGREGPTVQVGASIMLAGRPLRRHGAGAWADPGRVGGRHRRSLQHAARRHRLRHRGDEPHL